MSSAGPPRATEPPWLRIFLAVALALYGALFCIFLALTYEQRPTLDALDWALIYLQQKSADGWAAFFWHPHNVHRIVLARLLVAIDVEVFRGAGLPFLISGAVAHIATVGVLLRECARAALSREARAIAMLAVVLLFGGAHLAILIAVPTLSVFLHTVLFVVLAVTCLNGAQESRHPRLVFALALLCAALAPLGLSGGLLVWPVLVWLAWRTRYALRLILLVAVLGAAEWVVYFDGIVGERVGADMTAGLLGLDYIIRLLGLPWSRAPNLLWMGRIVGAAVLVLGALLLLRTTWQSEPTRLQRTGAAMILFTFAVAAAAALVRGGVDPEHGVPIRYAIFAAMAQLGIVFVSAEQIAEILRRSTRPLAVATALAIFALFLALQIGTGRAAFAVTQRGAAAWRQLEAGEWTPSMTTAINPSRERAELALRLFKQNGLYGFRP